MKTNQPVWQLIANLGDVNPLTHGGLFVYVDKSGVYPPECVRLERITSDETTGKDERWEVRRFVCEPCTFVNGILSDNRFHPDKPAWFAKPESERAERPQDTTYLADLAESVGETVETLAARFCSSNPQERALAWQLVGEYHGFDNLDAYPQTLTRKDVFNRYRAECFPRSVRRTSRASVRNSYGHVLRVGSRVSFRRVNDPKLYHGTIKAIDRVSSFARAYGPQITFTDNGSTVTANDCQPYVTPSGETGPFAIATI